MSSTTTLDSVVCKCCRRQFAKYTCPSCNVPYCSLTCFRSEAHSRCSETFYKKEIVTGIHAEPSKTAQERSQMLELLKRFEEDVEKSSGEDEDDTELSQRLSSIDLDTASVDAIWSMLNPEERKRFLGTIKDPSSDAAQKLLSSEELVRTLREPWWAVDEVPDDSTEQRMGKPAMMEIPDAMLIPLRNRPLLIYNSASICLVYAFVVRRFGVVSLSSRLCDESDLEEALELLSTLLPFLFERKSTLVYGGVSGVITDLFSRVDQTISPELLATLLLDCAHLMTPLDIIESTEESILDSHPHQRPLLILSDLARLLSLGIEKRWVPQQSLKRVPQKLVFYGAHIATMPSPLLRGVVEELKQKGEAYREEARVARRSREEEEGRWEY